VRAGTVDQYGSWHLDGPHLPLEFARHSGRKKPAAEQYVSLVIVEASVVQAVTTLWAPLILPNGRGIEHAVDQLAKREGIEGDQQSIGRYPPSGGPRQIGSDAIEEWAVAKKFDGVVWTALKPNWSGASGRMPSEADVVTLLREKISNGSHVASERYVRSAPRQITTPFRSAIERELGWTPV
jgi:hypothetical protein